MRKIMKKLLPYLDYGDPEVTILALSDSTKQKDHDQYVLHIENNEGEWQIPISENAARTLSADSDDNPKASIFLELQESGDDVKVRAETYLPITGEAESHRFTQLVQVILNSVSQHESPVRGNSVIINSVRESPDRKLAEKIRSERIEAAANKLLENLGVDAHGGMRPIPVEKELLDELRDALSR